MFTNVYNSKQEDSFVDKKLKVSMKKYTGETSVVSLRMPNELIIKIDEVCEKTGRTRNELIIKSLDFALENMLSKAKMTTKENYYCRENY